MTQSEREVMNTLLSYMQPDEQSFMRLIIKRLEKEIHRGKDEIKQLQKQLAKQGITLQPCAEIPRRDPALGEQLVFESIHSLEQCKFGDEED